MVSRRLLLECEDVKARELFEVKRRFLEGVKRKIVLIIPWSTRDPGKEARYSEIIREYFEDLGIKSMFLNREDPPAQIEEKFGSVEVVYLPGGDPFLLLREIRERGVDRFIEGFNGFIIGNSAGALILSRCFFSYEDGGVALHRGLGLTDFCLAVHYTEEKAGDILELSYGREVVALSDGSSIIVEDNRIVGAWGEVFKINNGNIIRLHI